MFHDITDGTIGAMQDRLDAVFDRKASLPKIHPILGRPVLA